MPLRRLDHVNLRTNRLAAMIEWYGRVLDLQAGPRPPFVGFGGAWLYCEGFPIVHLVEATREHAGADPKLEHFAIAADGMEAFLRHLRAHRVPYRVSTAPGAEFGIQQINVWDPDGNHIHIDFVQGDTSPLFVDYDPD